MATKTQIDYDIPIPRKRVHKRGLTAKMRQMDIGASFLETATRRPNVFAIASNIGIEIRTRQDEEHPELIRVWRVK